MQNLVDLDTEGRILSNQFHNKEEAPFSVDEALKNLDKFQLFNDNEVQNSPEESKTDYFKEKSLEKLVKVEEMSNFTLEKKEEVKKAIVKRKSVTSSSAEISNTQEEA